MALPMWTRVVALGEMLSEFVAVSEGAWRGPFPSGAPAIFADQAARAGAAAAMVGAVGRDAFGAGIVRRLRADGVDCAGVAEVARPTGVAFVAYAPDGSRAFVFHVEASAAVDIPPWAPGPGDLLHLSGSSLGMGPIRARAVAAAEAAVAAGGALSLDPNVRPELMGDPGVLADLRRLVGMAQVLLPSEADVAALWPGLSAEGALDAMLAGGARVAAVKRGARGALVADREGRVDLPGHAVAEVDPTGAGDCFGGTLVARLMAGDSLGLAARRANAGGALAVGRLGPMEGNPTLAEIDGLLGRGA